MHASSEVFLVSEKKGIVSKESKYLKEDFWVRALIEKSRLAQPQTLKKIHKPG